jgi:hypothetical protein
MIKKSISENEIIHSMQLKLAEAEVEEGMHSLDKAVDYIGSAIDILDETGLHRNADELLTILLKIAKKHYRPRDPRIIPDRHKPQNSDQMIKNLLNHGTVFNLSDDGNAADDLLDTDISDELEVEDIDNKSTMTFEDEID